ncbi:3'(2'),5'-bisphosphate nucleotidase CysQ [Candidatus Hepatincolaceae symbiont of Richtersius coronifer]
MFDHNKIDILLQYTKEAGDLAKQLKEVDLIIEKKLDNSFVTNADKALDLFLTTAIREKLCNHDLIISEEDVSLTNPLIASINAGFWSIDPIDSTKSYLNKDPNYCINIAYIENNIPIFGLIYAPETETMWYGSLKYGAFKQIKNAHAQQIFVRKIPTSGAVLMSSEEQITPKDILKKLNIVNEIKIPSAIKFCHIAEGEADYYIRKRNKACDWDIASGHALIIAAGGSVNFMEEHANFRYGIPPYLAPSLLASGKI